MALARACALALLLGAPAVQGAPDVRAAGHELATHVRHAGHRIAAGARHVRDSISSHAHSAAQAVRRKAHRLKDAAAGHRTATAAVGSRAQVTPGPFC